MPQPVTLHNHLLRIRGIISSVLANIYLHYALDLWFEKKVKPKMRGRAMMIRFADDFVCAFQFANDAERFYKVLPKRLKKFNLDVAEDKTSLMRFSRFHVDRKRLFVFLGFEFYWGTDSNGKVRLRRRTAVKKQKATLSELPMDQSQAFIKTEGLAATIKTKTDRV